MFVGLLLGDNNSRRWIWLRWAPDFSQECIRWYEVAYIEYFYLLYAWIWVIFGENFMQKLTDADTDDLHEAKTALLNSLPITFDKGIKRRKDIPFR